MKIKKMKINNIFKNLNRDLLSRLLDSIDPELPIDCASFSNANDDVINFTLAEHGLQ